MSRQQQKVMGVAVMFSAAVDSHLLVYELCKFGPGNTCVSFKKKTQMKFFYRIV
jgi:hypothetical protein